MTERMPIQLSARDRRDYPLCPDSIPMALLDEEWARRIHYQDLETLASRGGLSPQEAMGNMQRKAFPEIRQLPLRESIDFLMNQMLEWRGPW